jgi:hypothetical protein
MTIDDAKWEEIVAATQARIAKLNAMARERRADSEFVCTVEPTTDGGAVLATMHKAPYGTKCKAVARDKTGALSPVRIKRRNALEFYTKPDRPKTWAKLAGRSADEIVTALGLTDYFVVIGSTFDAKSS